ncbi:hypothetical protein F971_01973 [Acinetobacter vivianii]|uniref:DUF4055 domain-containing protein n=1 Tax=Acinetobacter vivianii TaxID=1776742 RepID=N8UWY3_9GAMM|nr:DUF4055 domain-containing protein [Acinetobacter vivianii]ENU92086.1 hypothetical protein F971_01973 [Acinetobacter vivianii]
MTSVTAQHPEYVKNLPLWEKVDDACKGQHVIKSKREKYLPRHNKSDSSQQALDAYESYLEHAHFYGVTGKTQGSLVGGAFVRLPNFQRPVEIEYLERNANGQGVSIHQLAQKALRGILRNYRCAVYVDYPDVQPSKTRAEEANRKAFPMIHVLSAKSIINWDTIIVGNQRKISLIVICENISARAPGEFEFKSTVQYRVLRLEKTEESNAKDDYVFTVQIYKKNSEGEFVGGEKKYPTDYNGEIWSYIPITFVGAIDNTPEIDNAPLLELAELNIAHYRDSADFQESVYFVGQPQYYLDSIDLQAYEAIKKDGLYIGCRNAFPTKVGVAQANPNTLSQAAMDMKKEQMKEIGARLIEKGSANKTATQSDNDDTVQHSVLSLCTVNVSVALTQALRWCAKFAMPNIDSITPEQMVYEISKEFSKPKFDNERSKQIYDACVAGKYPFKIWHEYQQTGEFPDYSYEEIQDMIAEEELGENKGLPTD